MSQFILNNKMSSKAKFELGEIPFFDGLPESGVLPMPAVVEDRIGTEMVLLLFDRTPFIYTLAKVKPFDLMLKFGMVETLNGPVVVLLFYVPNAATPDDPYFAHDYHVDPFDVGMMASLRDLARQSHWHLILVDGDQEVQSLLEFKNVYGLGEALAAITDAIEDVQHGNFALAKQEFCNEYSLQDLLASGEEIEEKKSPFPYTLKVDSTSFQETGKVTVDCGIPGIYNVQVCSGGGGWPTPYEVGIYLDAANDRCCIINWPRPCNPIKVRCEYGDFIIYLDTATENEIALATEETAEFFRDN